MSHKWLAHYYQDVSLYAPLNPIFFNIPPTQFLQTPDDPHRTEVLDLMTGSDRHVISRHDRAVSAWEWGRAQCPSVLQIKLLDTTFFDRR
jgi:hypothetical protein